jgi:hypothetical protein
MKQHSTATCFANFLLPYLLFVRDPDERERIVMSSCLAWNIALFPDAAQREERIAQIWEMVEADNRASALHGLERRFKQDLRRLVVQKRDLFPWLTKRVIKAELTPGDPVDVLCVETDQGIEEIELVPHPSPIVGLPLLADLLRSTQQNGLGQVNLLLQARQKPRALSDILTTQLATAYCVLRADLVGYHRMLTVWRIVQPACDTEGEIAVCLAMLDAIEQNTQSVLALLTDPQSDES